MNGSIALLYYENPTGNVTALLQYITTPAARDLDVTEQTQWADISSQSSRSLPAGYINSPGLRGSHTLYEGYPGFNFSTPFGDFQRGSGCIFFSYTSELNDKFDLAYVGYPVVPGDYQGLFSGMYYTSLEVARLFSIDIDGRQNR